MYKCCCQKKTCKSTIDSESTYVGKCNCCVTKCQPCRYPCKDPCPLKSFCDPGNAVNCNVAPLVNPLTPKRQVTTWKVNYLVANRPQEATHFDPDLIAPRGIIVFENQLWVANAMSDKITNYDLFGNKLIGAIQVRWNRQISSFPTGMSMNCGSGFPVITVGGTQSRPSTMLTCTKTGDVVAYNPTLDINRGYVVISRKIEGGVGVYTGMVIVNDLMYIANFFEGYVDVFDYEYQRVGIQGRNFIDNYSVDPLPGDFRPFNVAYIAPYIYVVYAKIDVGLIVHHVIGPGSGYINVFTLDGTFVRRLYSRGVLNAPWSIIPAPNECGIPPGSFLVNNIGDGRINIFDREGNFIGPMLSQAGIPIVISGIQAITPYYISFNEIFFTASADIETRGIMGSLVKDQVITI